MLIIPEYDFEMMTDKYGRVRVKGLTPVTIKEIIKRIPDFKTRPGYDVTITCASVLCIDDQDKPIDATHLSDVELLEFAEKYLGNRVMVVDENDRPVNELPRREGDGSVEYCGRVIADEIGSYEDRFKRFVETSGFLNASKEINKLLDIVGRSENLSRYAGFTSAAENIRLALADVSRISEFETSAMKMHREADAIYKLANQGTYYMPSREALKVPIPPLNPIYETNRKIEVLAEQAEIFTGTLTEHLSASAVALRNVAEHIEAGAKSSRRQNNVMILLAILAIVVPFITYVLGKSVNEKTIKAPVVVTPMDLKPKSTSKSKGQQTIKQPKSQLTNSAFGVRLNN